MLGAIANAQIIDKYGLRIGGGLSKQYYDCKGIFLNDFDG
jgi:hypothetical protein